MLAKSFLLEKALYFSATVRGHYSAGFGSKGHQHMAAVVLKPRLLSVGKSPSLDRHLGRASWARRGPLTSDSECVAAWSTWPPPARRQSCFPLYLLPTASFRKCFSVLGNYIHGHIKAPAPHSQRPASLQGRIRVCRKRCLSGLQRTHRQSAGQCQDAR